MIDVLHVHAEEVPVLLVGILDPPTFEHLPLPSPLSFLPHALIACS